MPSDAPVDRVLATRLHRAHQGWWREKILGRPAGPPTSHSAYLTLTNCLPIEHEGVQAAAEGLNLMSDAAREYAHLRCDELDELGGLAESDRLWRNLLSSQPLAFSIVGELRAHPQAAARALSDLSGLPVARLARLDSGKHTLLGLEAEWFPPRERHTGDLSGFDAAAYVELEDGSSLLLTIEVKYTDTFSSKPLDPDRYAGALAASGVDRAAAEAIVKAGGSQFLRSVLLTDSVRRGGVSGDGPAIDRALAVVLCREDDRTAHKVVDTIAGYEPATPVAVWSHRALFDACAAQPELTDWAGRMRQRYLLPE